MAKGGRRHKGGKKKNRQREQKPSFHILCEGVNTEPLYFAQFPISNMAHCKGYGQTKMTLVNTAIQYKRRNGITTKSKDQVWVVFDYDYNGKFQPKQKEDYNNAIDKAEKNNIKWAVSNDSFELWYVLHFQKCETQQLRFWHYQKLKDLLGEEYDKERETAKKMYDLLLPKQAKAIERAKILKEKYSENDKAHADKNPFTTVHELVIELNKFNKPYLKETLKNYKEIIEREFIEGRTRGMPKARFSVAKKALNDYKEIDQTPEHVIELMLCYVQSLLWFSSKSSTRIAEYYTTAENMFQEALNEAKKLGIEEKFKETAQAIVMNACEGEHHDSLMEIYEEVYEEFIE